MLLLATDRRRGGWYVCVVAQVVWFWVLWDLSAWGLLPVEVVLTLIAIVGIWRSRAKERI